MQQKLKFNLHGAVGVVFLVLIFGIAVFLNWNINWWYFSITAVLYSVVVILLMRAEENAEQEERLLFFKWLFGCHLTLLFLAVGLLFPRWWFFFPGSSIIGGLAIPFLLLKTSQGKISVHLHGLIALLLIILMIGVGFPYYFSKNFGKIYAGVYLGCVLLAIMAYIVVNILLNRSSPQLKSQELKLQLGCHVAFILLIVGLVIPLKDVGSGIAFFIASIAIGLAIPHLLFRSS